MSLQLDDVRWDVFISYPSVAREAATRLHRELVRLGRRVFLDHVTLLPSDVWPEAIATAQRQAQLTVVLVSNDSPGAFYQTEEILYAISLLRRARHHRRVVPIYLDDEADPPMGLRSLQGVMLSRCSDMAGAARAVSRLIAPIGVPTATSTIGVSHWAGGPVGWRKEVGRRESKKVTRLATAALTGHKSPIVVVHGSGGWGKTRIAEQSWRALQEVFGAGYWVEFGDDHDSVSSINRALEAHGQRTLDVEKLLGQPPSTVRAELARTLEGTPTPLLIVADDVSRGETLDLLPIDNLKGRSPNLVCIATTRNLEAISSHRQVSPVGVPPLSPEETMRLFKANFENAAHFRRAVLFDEACRNALDRLTHDAQGWPILLDLIASRLASGVAEGASPLNQLLAIRSELAALGPGAFDADRVGRTLRKGIPGEEWRKYLSLGALPRPFPQSLLCTVWPDTDVPTLVEDFLSRRMLRYGTRVGELSMHDLLYEYIRKHLKQRPEDKRLAEYRVAKWCLQNLRSPDTLDQGFALANSKDFYRRVSGENERSDIEFTLRQQVEAFILQPRPMVRAEDLAAKAEVAGDRMVTRGHEAKVPFQQYIWFNPRPDPGLPSPSTPEGRGKHRDLIEDDIGGLVGQRLIWENSTDLLASVDVPAPCRPLTLFRSTFLGQLDHQSPMRPRWQAQPVLCLGSHYAGSGDVAAALGEVLGIPSFLMDFLSCNIFTVRWDDYRFRSDLDTVAAVGAQVLQTSLPCVSALDACEIMTPLATSQALFDDYTMTRRPLVILFPTDDLVEYGVLRTMSTTTERSDSETDRYGMFNQHLARSRSDVSFLENLLSKRQAGGVTIQLTAGVPTPVRAEIERDRHSSPRAFTVPDMVDQMFDEYIRNAFRASYLIATRLWVDRSPPSPEEYVQMLVADFNAFDAKRPQTAIASLLWGICDRVREELPEAAAEQEAVSRAAHQLRG